MSGGGSTPPGGGGSSAPALPVWTFAAADSSDPASGKFTTDNIAPASTARINLSKIPKNDSATAGTAPFLSNILSNSILVLVSSTGQQYLALAGSFTDEGDYIQIQVSDFGALPNWSGDFQVSFWPSDNIPDLAATLAQSSITPIADGTYDIVGPLSTGSITFQSGICTAFTPNS